MSDTFGAAPYTPEQPSLWARFAAWLRRGALDEVTTYNARVEAALGRPLGARRARVVDARGPHVATGSYGDGPRRACGAVHSGRCPRERVYAPPPAKDGPRHPSTPVRE